MFHHDGTLWYNMDRSGDWGSGGFPTIEDVNGDGSPEIVSGAYVYEADGTLLWSAPGSGGACNPASISACPNEQCDPVAMTCVMASGPTMVLGFTINGTLTPMVVLRDGAESVHLLMGTTGAVVASATWPPPPPDSSGNPAESAQPPCRRRISMATGTRRSSFRLATTCTRSSTRARRRSSSCGATPISDYIGQCGAAGSAAFDFNGDGKADVVYHDTEWVYVLNGPDGTLLFQAPRTSDTDFETPVIADVDHDGHADILFTNDGDDNTGASDGLSGVKLLSNTGNTWPETRGIWSDHAYHQSEITDSDGVPRVEVPSWKTSNTWRDEPDLLHAVDVGPIIRATTSASRTPG